MKRTIALLLVGLSHVLPATACDGLVVDAPWIRLPPPSAGMAAAYATLTNTGKSPLVLDRVRADDFSSAEWHRVSFIEGRAQMRQVDNLVLASNESVVAAPGGLHIMLGIGEAKLQDEMLLELEFHCNDGQLLTTWFQVRRSAPQPSKQ